MMKRQMLKKYVSGALIATMLLSVQVPQTLQIPGTTPYFGTQVAHAEEAAKLPALEVESKSGLLMDAKSGQILWAKDEHAKRYPASVTKIMTMMLAYEAVEKGEKQLTDIVPISQTAYGTEGSSVWLDPKEKFTLAEMMEFITIQSANDACVAVAEYVGGSEEGFVARMNEKAKELGMNDTHFADTNGLHHPDHYTSAYDIAIMARELITKYPQVLDVTKVQSKMIRDGAFKLENTNHVLGQFEGLDGLKTGFTDQAGYCLAGTAERDGMRLISVQLFASSDAKRVEDTKKILDYGYANFKQESVIKQGEAVSELAPISKGKEKETEAIAAGDLMVAVPKNGGAVEKKVVFDDVEAPVAKDTKLGELQIVQDGKVVSKVDLVAKQDVEKGSWLRLGMRGIGNFFSGMFGAIGSSISGLFE